MNLVFLAVGCGCIGPFIRENGGECYQLAWLYALEIVLFFSAHNHQYMATTLHGGRNQEQRWVENGLPGVDVMG